MFFTWPATCCGTPPFAALGSTYLIILVSDWPKLPISLQASSGDACRSLAALISLPRFSASSRKGTNCFMHSSEGPCDGDAVPRSNAEPVPAAAPVTGNELGGAPTTPHAPAP